MALSLAVCRLLLGDPAGALRVLQDDEQAQAAAVAQRQQQQQAAGLAAAPGAAWGCMGAVAFAGRERRRQSARHGVLYVRLSLGTRPTCPFPLDSAASLLLLGASVQAAMG